ncbi:amidohydrolase family protein [Arcobacter nitrofigilis]|uniref:hypothetical protein n=1 Tax=Arcobacter nitrofigilis TaxID=28199 RepID=UPI0002F5F9A1|nr:hypothetical protein [Arcobacter nitrofigilis]
MPNLLPPITTKKALLSYKQRIKESCKEDIFTPYVTIFFQVDYSYSFLEDIKDEIIAVKLYPFRVTTNSETGVSSMDVETLRPTLETMSKLGIPLCVGFGTFFKFKINLLNYYIISLTISYRPKTMSALINDIFYLYKTIY